MRGNLKRTVHGCGRLNQRMQRNMCTTGTLQSVLRTHDVIDRLHLGQHDVAELVACFAHNGGNVFGKCGVIYGMHACCDATAVLDVLGQLRNQQSMGFFLANGCAVFTVQRHIKHAGAKLLQHLRLQFQALAHAHFHAAVMVADRQHMGCCLGAQQDLAGMAGCTHEWQE